MLFRTGRLHVPCIQITRGDRRFTNLPHAPPIQVDTKFACSSFVASLTVITASFYIAYTLPPFSCLVRLFSVNPPTLYVSSIRAEPRTRRHDTLYTIHYHAFSTCVRTFAALHTVKNSHSSTFGVLNPLFQYHSFLPLCYFSGML